MMITVIALTLGVAAIFLIWVVFGKRNPTKDQPVTYVCPVCDDHHCECHREEDGPDA